MRLSADEVKRMLGAGARIPARAGGMCGRTRRGDEGGGWRAAGRDGDLLPAGGGDVLRDAPAEERRAVCTSMPGTRWRQVQLWPDGTGLKSCDRGTNWARGPGRRCWFRVRACGRAPGLRAGGEWALLGCTVTPGFEFEDYESGDVVALGAGWPEWAEAIRELCRG